MCVFSVTCREKTKLGKKKRKKRKEKMHCVEITKKREQSASMVLSPPFLAWINSASLPSPRVIPLSGGVS